MPGAPLHAHLSHQTVNFVDPNVFETANAGFAQAMYEEFLRDPAAVGPEWRRLFESGVVGERPSPNGQAVGRPGGQADAGTSAQPEGATARDRLRHRKRPPGRLTARPPPPPCRRQPDQRARRQARRQHGAEPHGPYGHHVPRGAGRGAGGAATPAQRRAPGRGATREDLLHPPHRLGAGAGHQAAPGDGPHPDQAGRHPVSGTARGNRAGSRGGRAAEGREPGARRPRHPARRDHGLRRVPRGVRVRGGQGAQQPPHARRLRRRHHDPHQPGRPRHGRLGAEAHGRPGQHHRGRRDRLPGGVLRGVRGAAPRVRDQQGHDGHQHLRSPRHPGRGVGIVPGDGGRAAPGRRGVLRPGRGEPPAHRRELPGGEGRAGGQARRGRGPRRPGHVVSRGRGDGAGEGVPDARPPRRPARPARHAADRRSRAGSRPARPHARGHGGDPLEGAAHRGAGAHAGGVAALSPGHLLRDHGLRDRAHLDPRGAGLAAGEDRVRRLPAAAPGRGAARAAAPAHRGGGAGEVPPQGVPRAEAVLHRGRGHAGADARSHHRARGGVGRARRGDRHGAPRAAERAGPHRGPALRDDLRRVRGRPAGGRRAAHARGRHRRREVPPRRGGRVRDLGGQGDHRIALAQPEPPGVRLSGGGRPRPREADPAPGPRGAPRSHRRAARSPSTATPRSRARAWWRRR